MQLSEQHFTHRARVGKPLLGVARRETYALGRAVELFDDRPPPFDHVDLGLHRTGSRRMNGHLERRQVKRLPLLTIELQHPHEHRRNQLRMGHAMFFDQSEILERVESLHDHHGPTLANREPHRRLRGRVVQRRRGQEHHVFSVFPQVVEEGEERESDAGRFVGEWTNDALWSPSCARRIEHGRAQPLVSHRCGRLMSHCVCVVDHRWRKVVAIDNDHGANPRALSRCGQGHVQLRPRREENLRVAVVEDVGDLVGGQI